MKKVLFIMMLGLMFGQTKLETRIYEVSYNMSGYTNEYIDIQSITGVNLDVAKVYIYDVKNLQADDPQETNIYLDSKYITNIGNIAWSEGHNIRLVGNGTNDVDWRFGGYANYEGEGSLRIRNSGYDFSADFTFAVTAEFPEEDTGYIEEGYEYCLNEGFNLVSYPCDNSRAIPQAIPNSETFINSIIGEGVASQYLDGAGWVGNLTSLQSGDGYWFEAIVALFSGMGLLFVPRSW